MNNFLRTITPALISALIGISCSGNSGTTSTTENAVSSQSFPVTFSADSAFSFVKAQTIMGPRVPGSQAHKNAVEYLSGKLQQYNPDTILLDKFKTRMPIGAQGEVELTNILARWGTDRKNRVLLLAHFDTRPVADEDPRTENQSKPIDGANDGASGVGVLLEIARQLSITMPKNIGVDILFVDGEDSGNSSNEESWCLGTRHWVNNMPYDKTDMPRYAILLDMVGGFDARFHREYFSQLNARRIVDKIWSRAATSGFASRFPNEIGSPITDDHIVLQEAGIPAVDIIENRNPQTGTFNPAWHTLNDNISNIDSRTLGTVGQVVANVIYNEN